MNRKCLCVFYENELCKKPVLKDVISIEDIKLLAKKSMEFLMSVYCQRHRSGFQEKNCPYNVR